MSKDVMQKMLDAFISDPPDSDFQQGFLEGLLVFAHEGLGMRMEDEAFRLASDIAYRDVLKTLTERTRRGFQIIQGGLSEEEPKS